jgi:hypothetical protein
MREKSVCSKKRGIIWPGLWRLQSGYCSPSIFIRMKVGDRAAFFTLQYTEKDLQDASATSK